MKQIVLLGAGKIGQLIAEFLASSQDYTLKIVDINQNNLKKIQSAENITKIKTDIKDVEQMQVLFKNAYAVLNAYPFHLAKDIATAAKKTCIHYLDLTEDIASAQAIQALAKDAESVFIP